MIHPIGEGARSYIVCLAVSLLLGASATGAAAQDLQCDTVTPGVTYCAQGGPQASFISEQIYPNLLGNFHMRTDPLVVSRLIARRVAAPITDVQDALNLIADEMLYSGIQAFPSLSDAEERIVPTSHLGAPYHVSFLGRHAHGHVMAALVGSVITLDDERALIVLTSDERADTVEPALLSLHTQSLANLRLAR